MESPDPSAQTDEKPRADPGARVTPAAPVSGSLGARQPVEESTTTAGGLGDSKRSASAGDGSAIIPEAMAVTAGPSGAKTGVVSEALESGSAKPMVPKELMVPPEVS